MSIYDDKIWQTGAPSDEISSNIQRANDRGMFSFTKRMQYKHQLEYENDSDFYSGHKTLLKISIYQFNKTSSGARPYSFGSPLSRSQS